MRLPCPARRRRRWPAVALALLLAAGLRPDAAAAHGIRLPLAEWGGFDASLLRCQRSFAHAAAACAETVWSLRRECREGALHGGEACVPEADPRRAAARRLALDRRDDACPSERDLRDLQFLGDLDSAQDLGTFCYGTSDTLDALVYAPAAASEAIARTCAVAAADAASEAMRWVFRARRRAMDDIAAAPLAAPGRDAGLPGTERGKAAAARPIAARLAARCPEFAARYGRDPAAFATLLLARADCLGGAFYIQDAVRCPDPVCGNGLVEPPETCDDANTADGDDCPSDCMR